MGERTKILEAVFHAAMDLPAPEERARYLAQACGHDPALRREVEELLRSAELADAVFQAGQDACRLPESGNAAVIIERPGDRIGRYTLLEKIGEGGMGIVYMAEQTEPVRRRVALKIIKLGMDTRQVVTRFEAERQALAMMDHPHIAQVLDAGATDTGRPYFVMELVQGVSLTQFCAENRLPVEARLRLFIPVCEAIQSAHQKGIIHRDIKPSNVLVTLHDGKPHPLVIDFGVAKAVDQKLTEKTLFTHFTTMIGTPAYMSPEQAGMSRLDVDTRSDIYSLGVLLYELLTGTLPFPEARLRSVAYSEMQRIITEDEPERPSTRWRKSAALISAPVARPAPLSTDLDWIVMKCLEKDRNRRYETASGLAADLQRHLADEPVVARPPSAAYRFRKLVRRHKLRFAAAAFALTVLILAAAVSTWQAVKARRAEQLARDQSRDAEAIKDFLVRQVLAANPFVQPEPDPGKHTMIERVARAVETEFSEQPKVRAELHMALAMAFAGLGNFAHFAAQCEKALAIRRMVLGPHHSETLWALAGTAQAYQRLGRRDEGVRLISEALAAVRSTPHELSSGEAEVLWTYYDLQSDVLPSAEVLANLREALAISKRLLPPKDIRLQNKVQYLAYLQASAGRWDEAELLREIRECEQLHGPDSPLSAQFRKFQAAALIDRGRWPEARAILERILPIFHASLGTNHIHTLDAEGLHAQVYEHAGQIAEASQLNKSLHLRLSRLFPDWRARNYSLRVARYFVRQQDFAEARAVYGPLRESWETSPPENPRQFEGFIEAAAATQGWPAAARVGRSCLERFSGQLSAGQWVNLASTLLHGGDEPAYRQAASRALAAAAATTNLDEQRVIAEAIALGPNAWSEEEIRKCAGLLSSLEAGLARASSNQSAWLRPLGALELRIGRFPQSLAHLDRVLQKERSARSLLLKAIALLRLAQPTEARAALAEAESLMNPRLLDPPGERERDSFAGHNERAYLILQREARALLGPP